LHAILAVVLSLAVFLPGAPSSVGPAPGDPGAVLEQAQPLIPCADVIGDVCAVTGQVAGSLTVALIDPSVILPTSGAQFSYATYALHAQAPAGARADFVAGWVDAILLAGGQEQLARVPIYCHADPPLATGTVVFAGGETLVCVPPVSLDATNAATPTVLVPNPMQGGTALLAFQPCVWVMLDGEGHSGCDPTVPVVTLSGTIQGPGPRVRFPTLTATPCLAATAAACTPTVTRTATPTPCRTPNDPDDRCTRTPTATVTPCVVASGAVCTPTATRTATPTPCRAANDPDDRCTRTPTATRTPCVGAAGAACTATPTGTPRSTPGCNPRPPVQVNVTPAGNGRLQVTITVGTNASTPTNELRDLVFGGDPPHESSNDLISFSGVASMDGRGPQHGHFEVPLPPGTQTITFDVRRAATGQATTVHIIVIDDCGPWPVIVGGGPNAF
jgi:hypothetical protein